MHHLLSAFFHRFVSSKPALRRHSYAKVGHSSRTRKQVGSPGGASTVFRNGEYHLTARQLRALIDSAVSPRDRSIILLLAETGIRRSELAALDVSDHVAGQPLLIVRRGKGGKLRMLPLTSSLQRQIRSICGRLTSGPLFTSRSGTRLGVRQINRIVAMAGKRAGITSPNPRHAQITCHLLRHSFARLWKENGGSVETLSKILGHASVKTTMDVYGTESLADVQRNYQRMMEKLAKKGSNPKGASTHQSTSREKV